MSKCFLDDDWVPDPKDAPAFEAGRQAERDHANSPAEQERWRKHAEHVGHQIAEGLKTLLH